MSWEFKNELVRKAFHLLILGVLFLYYFISLHYSKPIALISLCGLLVLVLIFEILRLEAKMKLRIVRFFLRPKENTRMSAAVSFLLSTIICLAVFDFRVAIGCLLMATFGDLFAALVGHRFGKTTIYEKKTFEGSLGGLVINLTLGVLILPNMLVGILMAIIATIVEVYSVHMDDNLLIPIITGFIGQMLI